MNKTCMDCNRPTVKGQSRCGSCYRDWMNNLWAEMSEIQEEEDKTPSSGEGWDFIPADK